MGEATLHASLLFETDMINYLSVFNQNEKKEKRQAVRSTATRPHPQEWRGGIEGELGVNSQS